MNAIPNIPSAALEIAERLIQNGYRTLFVGGCVRDRLAGKKPKDIDIVTSARPEDVMRIFPKSRPVGICFGVVLVRWQKMTFEVATFRTDGNYSDSRRPDSVSFSNEQEDAKRRDFTVNGLMIDPSTGEILDYVGGMDDWKEGLLRAIGDPVTRFREDALRLLRAIRFSATLSLEIEPSTWAAILSEAESVQKVASERIHAELDRMWLSPHRVHALDLLDHSGMLQLIIPELSNLKGCTQSPIHHPEGDVWTHSRLALSMLPEKSDLALVWATLLHDIAKPLTRSVDPGDGLIHFYRHESESAKLAGTILRRLHQPCSLIEKVQFLINEHMVWHHLQDMRLGRQKIRLSHPYCDDALELHRADCLASNGDLSNYNYAVEQRKGIFSSGKASQQPLLNGDDLIALGFTPGPHFSTLLREAYEEQMEGKFSERVSALAWARSQANRF